MLMWDMWKKGFETWERTTASYMEQVLRSPVVLRPSGQMLTAVMKAKASTDRASAGWWGMMGLPTKRDQERMLHALNQMQSRIIDLEEKLDDLQHD